ncbi:MAG: glucose-6-phosphate isomerase, partial [Kiritimatiellae bacterium]|nr:glucose-6-phosphate isomerase [Kiritimatiellia bacterium]
MQRRKNPCLEELAEWKELKTHFHGMRRVHLRDLFRADGRRAERFSLTAAGLFLDYSKNLVTAETMRLLLSLAARRHVRENAVAMFSGEKINRTEGRAVLHVALRNRTGKPVFVDGKDVMSDVQRVLRRMEDFSIAVRSGAWTGHTGKRMRNVINIGIGGSHLGPAMACMALRPYAARELTVRFVSNVDATDFVEATRDLDPAETLFIVASKSFRTME